MKVYIVTYLKKNGQRQHVAVTRDAEMIASGMLLDEQIAQSDVDFAEIVAFEKLIESTIILLN